MRKLWTSLLWNLVTKIVGNASLTQNIFELVQTAASWKLSGQEKKARVMAELGQIRDDLDEIGGWLINLAIEAAVAWIKARVKD